MNIKCENCGMINDNSLKRCLRCNHIIQKPKQCGECKGCSLKIKGHCN